MGRCSSRNTISLLSEIKLYQQRKVYTAGRAYGPVECHAVKSRFLYRDLGGIVRVGDGCSVGRSCPVKNKGRRGSSCL